MNESALIIIPFALAAIIGLLAVAIDNFSEKKRKRKIEEAERKAYENGGELYRAWLDIYRGKR